ncbi:trichohyalin-like isoform X2 [Actinia tenebrosa]|uniref:Trichohyalin-like isoform X2 n=1 Tax=Actinia tenebrosa TaxID=6105 RepID=A0A6P8IL42_ACTTE|nr:trichohyalin-like isoform X2 [Actinia tenebrosa]
MDTDLKWVITEEERTRHDALFYSQNPKKGYLSGEQARSLFIRSRLPLSELSKIWKLADISRDNLLDVSEFATAMHLIQLRLRGSELPEKLPTSLTPVRATLTVVPPMSTEEWNAYYKTFVWKDANASGFLDTETACGIMMLSNLESSTLSKIWNLSDIDRDAKLSLEEFAIAFHLLRYCKKGNELEGSIDVKAMLPNEALKDDGEAKKKRHAEVQSERRQLLTLKQKLCSEIAGGLDDATVNEKIRPELNKIEDRLSVLEKEETELRRSLLNLKDRSKKENFKPFDKSFLLKKRLSGEDLFKGRDKKLSTDKDSVLFERLWTSNENTVPIKESENGPTVPEITLNNNYSETQPSDISFTEVTRPSRITEKSVPKIVNGVADSEDSKTPLSSDSSRLSKDSKQSNSRTRSTEKASEQASISKASQNKDNLDDSFSSALDTKRKVVEEKVKESLAKPRKGVERDESFSWARIEKRPVITKRVKEEVEFPDKEYQKKKNSYKGKSPVQEEVSVCSAEKAESVADQNINKLFEQMSAEMENGDVNGIEHGGSGPGKSGYKLPVGRVLSHEEEKELIESGALRKAERQVPSSKNRTQEELLPIYLEEKRAIEEERRKKREIEEEKRRQAREELKRQEEERSRELMERKYAMQEARGKLEKHISQSDKDEYHTTDAGYLIERELEEQRRREEEVQRRIEEARKDETTLSKDKHQKPHAKQVYIETGKAANNKPHPVVVRPKTDPKHHHHRKSWVELEIEEQKRKDDEMRREIEQRNSELTRLTKDQKPLHAIEKEIEITGRSIKSTTTHRTVESQPPSALEVRRGAPDKDVSRPVTNAQRPAHLPDRNVAGPRVLGSVRADKIPMDSVDGKMTAEDKEIQRKIQEEEERRRLKQIEQIQQESRKREAEELMRLREIREEELRKKREIALKEAEKRKLEEQHRAAEAQRIADSRRLTFQAQKVRLEERVITAMKETQVQSEVVLRNKTPGTRKDDQEVPSSESEDTEKRERRKSVRDTKALFEHSAPNQEESKVVLRKKRQSLNLENSGGQQKPGRKDRASFYSDATSTQEFQTQIQRERATSSQEFQTQTHRDKEFKIIAKNEAPTRLNLGNISEKRQQFESQRQQNSVERHQTTSKEKPRPSESKSPPPPLDQEDAGAPHPMTDSFFPSISSNRIKQEMEELRQREQEIHVRRQAMVRAPSSDKEMVTKKTNPAPPASSDLVVRRKESEQKTAPKKQQNYRKSFIEIEKEKEREREEELQREREAISKEVEEQKKKKEEEAKAKRIMEEEKERKKNKPNAMSSRWDKRGQFK